MNRRVASRLGLPLAVLHLAACTEWVIREGPPASTVPAIESDALRVTATDGRRFDFGEARIEGDSLVGMRRVRPGPGVAIPPRVALALDEVASVESRERAGRRTALLVGGIAAAAVVLFLVIDRAISRSLEEAVAEEFFD